MLSWVKHDFFYLGAWSRHNIQVDKQFGKLKSGLACPQGKYFLKSSDIFMGEIFRINPEFRILRLTF